MTGAELAAVLTAAAGLIAAVTALVQAFRASSAVGAHITAHAIEARASRAYGPAGPDTLPDRKV